MGVNKTRTLKMLFRRFTLSLIFWLLVAVLVPFALELYAVNAGMITRANQSELQAKELVPVLSVAPDISKVVIPQGCTYLILDKEFNELFGNMSESNKAAALRYAKGEFINMGDTCQFTLVVREKELCVLQYDIGTRFTASWIPFFFPSPDVFTFVLVVFGSLLVIMVLTAKFAKDLRLQLVPLFDATAEVTKQNLDFEVGHSNIAEFEEVLLSFSDMKESLNASLERQWRGEQMQREQIAALAHDLKTPLTVIQGNADLISETKLDDEQRLYADYITHSSEQMQLYIKTLIELSRAATGYQLRREDINLSVFLNQLKTQIIALCGTKEVNLQMAVETLPAGMTGDKLLIHRAIMNVVNNALDYSPRGSTIYLTATGHRSGLQITVIDEGKGFSREDLLHAQEQFYMADHSRGLELHFGMGLFITKSIVEQHNGEVKLENASETGGAKVTLRFPVDS